MPDLPPIAPEPPAGISRFTFPDGWEILDARAWLTGQVGDGYRPRNLQRLTTISIHHTATPWHPASLDADLDCLLRIGQFHTAPEPGGRGWPGYAYHFTITPDGVAWYTGDWATLRYVVGAANASNVAIALLGDFTAEEPTDAALDAARWLIGELRYLTPGQDLQVLPHHDVPGTDPTACPGATWPSWAARLTEAPAPADPGPGGPENGGSGDPTSQSSRRDLVAYVRSRGAAAGAERELLALTIAETDVQAVDRRPKHPEDDAAFWPDVSQGIAQQTAAFSPEFRATGLNWRDGYPGADVVAPILAAYEDPVHAIDVALPQLTAHLAADGDALAALCHYNSPGLDPARNPNRANYVRGLALADRILAGEDPAAVLDFP